ncbi:MAG: LapA family protein [Betaproteobacteria bacterium]|nr:LapA family protein [Betaproteobacteria bacterium]
MRLLTWTIRIALFILLLAFAARNTEPVTLRFYFDLAWEAPLVVLLLAFFAAGAVLGLLAALGAVLRQRRVAARLRRELRDAGARADEAPTLPPPPAEG